MEFNLNHGIRHAQMKGDAWSHPQEWLKRTAGNDWVYYSTGGYAGVVEAIGEYYLPNLPYPTNSLIGGKPLKEPSVHYLLTHWHDLLNRQCPDDLPEPYAGLLKKIVRNTPARLQEKAEQLFDILGGRVSVMPPDARHVDYNIIPLPISNGCLYKCRFCKVKNKHPFHVHAKPLIQKTISRLKVFYNNDITNYNALFLGDHDALNAPSDVILKTARTAYHAFDFHSSYMQNAFLFMFGSVESLLSKTDDFFEELNRQPYLSYINIGLESYDPKTLCVLGKPITAKDVGQAFDKIQALNRQFSNIELTCNFVIDDRLPPSHFDALLELIRKRPGRTVPKGTVYLSPLAFGQPSRQVLYDFYRLKAKSRFPTFLYIIQRL